ncbi:MAG TPA: hypothetical protein VGE35_01560 [Candidatus Paceibacterota bacterium]
MSKKLRSSASYSARDNICIAYIQKDLQEAWLEIASSLEKNPTPGNINDQIAILLGYTLPKVEAEEIPGGNFPCFVFVRFNQPSSEDIDTAALRILNAGILPIVRALLADQSAESARRQAAALELLMCT